MIGTEFFHAKRYAKYVGWVAIVFGGACGLFFWLGDIPDTPDGLFHIHRVRALTVAIGEGLFFPRWFPEFAFGYGYPVFNFYAPAFYYPSALLHLTGLDLLLSLRIALVIWFGCSGLAMYLLLRNWVDVQIAVVGAVLYLFFPYHLYDLFVRGAFPEFAAFVWPPLILHFSYVLYTQICPKGTPTRDISENVFHQNRSFIDQALTARPLIWGSLAWLGLILTHNLTALMLALLFGVSFLLVVGNELSRKQRHKRNGSLFRRAAMCIQLWGTIFLLPILLGMLLSSWYILPAIMDAKWVAIGAQNSAMGYANHFADWDTIFASGLLYIYPSAAEPTVPLPGYVRIVLIATVVLRAFDWVRGKRPSGFFILIFLGTIFSIWLNIENSHGLWSLASPLLGKLQFPWRWQTMVSFLLSRLTTWMHLRKMEHWLGRYTRFFVNWSVLLPLLIASAFPFTLNLPRTSLAYQPHEVTTHQMWQFDAEYGQVGASWTGEFLPIWVTEQRWAIGRDPSEPGLGTESALPFRDKVTPIQAGYLDTLYEVVAERSVQLTFPQFFYPAWQIKIDGIDTQTFPTTNLGLLSVELPAGKYQMQLHWSATPAIWLGRILTLLGGGVLLLMLLRQKRNRFFTIAIWTCAGVGMIVVSSSATAIQQPIATQDIDFGPVHLDGVQHVLKQNKGRHSGDMLSVRLFWSVSESPSSPLIAFIHVTDQHGQIVAQRDEPLAGPYRPISRWQPGQLLDYTYTIQLPEQLPPGLYGLKAGLYPAGNAASPLIPEGASEPRVDIGSIEVHP